MKKIQKGEKSLCIQPALGEHIFITFCPHAGATQHFKSCIIWLKVSAWKLCNQWKKIRKISLQPKVNVAYAPITEQHFTFSSFRPNAKGMWGNVSRIHVVMISPGNQTDLRPSKDVLIHFIWCIKAKKKGRRIDEMGKESKLWWGMEPKWKR